MWVSEEGVRLSCRSVRNQFTSGNKKIVSVGDVGENRELVLELPLLVSCAGDFSHERGDISHVRGTYSSHVDLRGRRKTRVDETDGERLEARSFAAT